MYLLTKSVVKNNILWSIMYMGNGYMIIAELTREIDLLAQESYSMVESFVEQLIDTNNSQISAFKIFMEKMNTAEKSVQEHGFYSEEEVEKKLAE